MIVKPDYPDSVWNGLSANENRLSREENHAPEHEDWDQIVAEVISMQEALAAGVSGYDLKTVIGNENVYNTTMTNIDDLLFDLEVGSYVFELNLFTYSTNNSEGLKFDFDGGTCTITAFRAHAIFHDSTALIQSKQVSARGTDISYGSPSADCLLKVYGYLTTSVAGTFGPRMAKVTHVSGTAVAYTGSHMTVRKL